MTQVCYPSEHVHGRTSEFLFVFAIRFGAHHPRLQFCVPSSDTHLFRQITCYFSGTGPGGPYAVGQAPFRSMPRTPQVSLFVSSLKRPHALPRSCLPSSCPCSLEQDTC